MTRRFVLTMLAVVLAGIGRGSQAASLPYSAMLSGAAESPPNGSLGTGFALVIYDNVAHTLRVEVTFSGLTTGAAAAHIHATTAMPGTGTAPVATTPPAFPGFPLGATVTSGTYDGTLDLTQPTSYNPPFIAANGNTTAGAEAALAAALANDESYLNIHTSTVPGGEIRGFLQLVPEPSSIIMLGAGLLGVVACGVARRR
jgi:hypothetical protein